MSEIKVGVAVENRHSVGQQPPHHVTVIDGLTHDEHAILAQAIGHWTLKEGDGYRHGAPIRTEVIDLAEYLKRPEAQRLDLTPAKVRELAKARAEERAQVEAEEARLHAEKVKRIREEQRQRAIRAKVEEKKMQADLEQIHQWEREAAAELDKA